MLGEASSTPSAVPDAPKGRLEQALELVTEEAVRVLEKGRNPRAFQKTEKLLAIARAIRLECGDRVEDVTEPNVPNQRRGQAGPGVFGGAVFNAPIPGPAAYQDFQREETLAQIEATVARRRRDDAQTQLSRVQELEHLSNLDLSKLSQEVRDAVHTRISQITKEFSSEKGES